MPGRGGSGVLRRGAPKSDTIGREFGAIRRGVHGNLAEQFGKSGQSGQPQRDA